MNIEYSISSLIRRFKLGEKICSRLPRFEIANHSTLRFRYQFAFFILTTSVAVQANEVRNDQKRIYVAEQVRLAAGLTKRGFLDEAIKEYARVIKKFPRDPIVAEAWVRLAQTYAEKKDITAAIATFDEFFKRFPHTKIVPAAKYKYALILKKSKSAEHKAKALGILKNLTGNPKTPAAVKAAAEFQHAKILIAAGKTTAGSRIMTTLAETPVSGKPKDYYVVAAALMTADMLKKERKTAEAVKLLEPIVAANFADETIGPRLYITIGALQSEIGCYDDAAETFAKFAILFPKSPSAKNVFYNRLLALHKAGKHTKVVAETVEMEKKGEIAGANGERFDCVKGASLSALKFHQAAIKTWRKMLDRTKKKPYIIFAARMLIKELVASGNTKAASPEAIKLIESGKLDPATILETAEIAAQSSDRATAVQIFETANSKIPADTQLHFKVVLKLANALYRAGKLEKALAKYAEHLKINSQPGLKPNALLGTARVYKAMGDENKARQALRRLLKECPATPLRAEALISLATILLSDRKNWSEVKLLTTEVTKKFPKGEPAETALFYKAYMLFYDRKYNDALKILKSIKTSKSAVISQTTINAAAYEIWTLLKKGERKTALETFDSFPQKKLLLKTAPLSFLCDLGENLPPTKIKTAEFCFKRVISESKIPFLRQKALIGLAYAETAAGDAVKTIDYLKKAISIDAEPRLTSTACIALAKMLIERNANDSAILLLEKCLENPVDAKSSAAARLELAKVVSKNPKRLATARRYAMSVYVLSTNEKICVEAMLLSIKLSIELGKNEDALNIWSEFSKRFPQAAKSADALKLRNSIQN